MLIQIYLPYIYELNEIENIHSFIFVYCGNLNIMAKMPQSTAKTVHLPSIIVIGNVSLVATSVCFFFFLDLVTTRHSHSESMPLCRCNFIARIFRIIVNHLKIINYISIHLCESIFRDVYFFLVRKCICSIIH